VHYLDTRIDLDDPRTASVLDEVSLWSARFGALLLDHLSFAECRTVVDLGCGTGFLTLELADRFGSGTRVLGVDVWRQVLDRLRFRLEVCPRPNAYAVQGDGAALPLASGSVDLVVSNVGVNNFADPGQALAECRRVLRPGGSIALTTNPFGHMRELYAAFARVLDRVGDAAARERLERQEQHRFSKAALSSMLAGAGFGRHHTVEEELVLRYRDGAAFLGHWLTRFGFLDGWRAVAGPGREAEVLGELERELDRAAGEAGELRMTVPMLYVEAVASES
jgi:ubiquinone/menaquinone biosynthesis C-methylase UbiE